MTRRSALIIRLISPIIWIIVLPISICFWLYRKGIHFVLRIKYGNRYGGLMNFKDAFAVSQDKTKWIICTILITKCSRKIDLLEFVRERFRNEIKNHDYPKLTSTLHFYRGYAFWLKTRIDIEKCVKTIHTPDTYDEDFIKATASKLYSSKLPYDDTLMWDMHVTDNPMTEMSKEGTSYKYAAILRLNHVIGDGTATCSFVSRIFARDKSLSPDNLLIRKLEYMHQGLSSGFFLTLYNQMKQKVSFVFYILFLMIQKSIELREEKESVLHGAELSGDKHFVWAVEEHVQFVPLTKRIKNAFRNMKFSHVSLSAVTIGVARFLEKRNKQVPEEMTMLLSVLFSYRRIVSNKPIPLENKSSAAILELPTGKSRSFLDTLMTVKETCEAMTLLELWANKFLLDHVYALFPMNIRGRLFSCKSTGMLTVLPTGGRTTFLDNCYIESVLSTSPHFSKLGFTVTVATYDNKYQIGVMVDKNLIQEQKEVQELANEILGSFQLLYDELREKRLIE